MPMETSTPWSASMCWSMWQTCRRC
jgi:hypothetical protein